MVFEDGPQFAVGYTGKRFQSPEKVISRDKNILPTVGYTGYWTGKFDGNIGKVDVHKQSLRQRDRGDIDEVESMSWMNLPEQKAEVAKFHLDRSVQEPRIKPVTKTTSFPVNSKRVSPTKIRQPSLPAMQSPLAIDPSSAEADADPDRPRVVTPTLGYRGWYNGKSEGKPGNIDLHRQDSISFRDRPRDIPDIVNGPGEISTRPKNPTLGYCGYYVGKAPVGKLGHVDVHKSSISQVDTSFRDRAEDGSLLVMPENEMYGSNTKASKLGYTGYYRGKVDGKLGMIDLHPQPLGEWDNRNLPVIYGDNISTQEMTDTKSTVANLGVRNLNQLLPYAARAPHAGATDTTQKIFAAEIAEKVQKKLLKKFATVHNVRKELKKAFAKVDLLKSSFCTDDEFHEALQSFDIVLPPSEFAALCDAFRENISPVKKIAGRMPNKNIDYPRMVNTLAPSSKTGAALRK